MSKDNIHNVKNGSLLVSMPFLGDPSFERCVILLCEHNEEGSFGLMINQKTEFRLGDFNMFTDFDSEVFEGGPVQANTIHYIHSLEELRESVKIKKDLRWGGDFNQLKSIIDAGEISDNEIRFYVGYSGWGDGQLQEELERDSWIVYNDYSLDIFKLKPEEIWRQVLLEMGGKYAQLANYPIDPSLN